MFICYKQFQNLYIYEVSLELMYSRVHGKCTTKKLCMDFKKACSKINLSFNAIFHELFEELYVVSWIRSHNIKSTLGKTKEIWKKYENTYQQLLRYIYYTNVGCVWPSSYDALVPQWRVWVQFPALTPDSNFLIRQILRGSSDESSTWIPVTFVGDLNWVPSFGLWDEPTTCCPAIFLFVFCVCAC